MCLHHLYHLYHLYHLFDDVPTLMVRECSRNIIIIIGYVNFPVIVYRYSTWVTELSFA